MGLGLLLFKFRVDNNEKTVCDLGLSAGDIKDDWRGMRFCYIKDPDGLPVELHE